MDFKDSIKTIADRIDDIKDNLPTEEATKTALILPFIQALGYDIFNPNEVLPEMTCDIGTRRGERIDYAIFQDGEPIILMECKHWEQNLDLHETQLLRYFTVSTARFAILTNGIEYRFYTDTERPNIMDETPFLEINLLNLKDDKLESLRKFHKSYFNVSEILSSACELKYLNSLQDILEREFNNPSPDFVRVLCRQVEKTASFPQRVVERFTPIVKKSIQLYIRDLIFDRLTTLTTENQTITPPQYNLRSDVSDEGCIEEEEELQVTDEELRSFEIIKNILKDVIDTEKITYRKHAAYCLIVLFDSRFDWIIRLRYNNSENKKIQLMKDWITGPRTYIENPEDIYKYKDDIIYRANEIIESRKKC